MKRNWIKKNPISLQWFEEKTSQIDSLDIQLRALHSAVDCLTNQRRELANCTGATAKSIAVLGHGEPGASLGRALAQLAETLEKVEVIRKTQSNSDLYQFGEMLRDYVALIGAIKVGVYDLQLFMFLVEITFFILYILLCRMSFMREWKFFKIGSMLN